MDIKSNYSVFADCNSNTIILRVPSETLIDMVKSYNGEDKELILLKLQQARLRKDLKERMM